MKKKDSSPKNPTKKELLEMAQKLQKKATEDAEKIAEMEAEKAKILSTKENTDEEKEILAIEAEYNLKIKEKQDELDKLLKEKENAESDKENDSPEVNTEPEDPIEAAKKRVLDSINAQVDEEKRKNQEEIDKLSQSIKNDLTPDKPDIDQNKDDFQIEWNKKNTGENKGEFEIEINGKKTKIHIDEEKGEWKKSSRFVRFITFGAVKGKRINATKPKWYVYTSGNNETIENKYPDEYEFGTKEEAIEKFNEIAKECQKIKFEEEKKYMGPGAQQISTPTTPPSQQNINNPGTKTPEPVQNISQEQLLINFENLEKLMENKLDSRFRGKILKGLNNIENFGKGEGKANFAKRMSKNFINLALVGVVSSFAVDQIANAGIEIAGQTLSNTALAGGTSHYLINKIGVGLGVSAAMDRMGNKVPGKVRKWMPYVMGGGSVLAAGLLSGGTVAIAAGVGVVASKLLVNGYTNEKIESREKKARDELLEKIKKEGPEINPEKVKAFEEEYTKLLKKYENQRIWGKMGATLARFGLASVISTMTLEASGYAKDIHAENQAGIKDTEAGMKSSEDQDNTSQNDSIQEKQNDEIKSDSTETKTPVSDTTSTNKESDTVTSQNEDAKTQIDNNNDEEDKSSESNQDQNKLKEIKTDFSSKGAIETIKELQTKINTDYPKEVPAHLEEFAKADPTQMAIKLGLYNPEDTTGSESAMLIKGSTLGFDENGNLSIHDFKTGEDHILIEEKGSDDVIGKYEGKMFDSDHSSENIENNSEVAGQVEENTDLSINESLPRLEVDPETGFLIETNDEANSTDTNQNAGGDENTTNKEVSVTPETKLSPDMLEQIERTSEYNLDRIFPTDEAINQWYNIKTIAASTITHMSSDNTDEIYKPLVEYVHNLQRITGITNPHEATWTQPAESIKEYIERALEKAASDPKIGLDKVTL